MKQLKSKTKRGVTAFFTSHCAGLAATVTCDCGWEKTLDGTKADAIEHWDKHLTFCPLYDANVKKAELGRAPSDEQMDLRGTIIEAFEQHPVLSTRAISVILSADPHEVRRALRYFEREKLVRRAGKEKQEAPGQPSIMWEWLEES